eukprot:12421047-Alexandrium_andersonii.AAC.1
MSASLVGSEMCIRDRLWTAFSSFQQRQTALCGFKQFHAASDNFKQLRRAVSYTHLTLPTICSV